MKAHLGCGQVYLEGYINCDVKIKGHYLASERPDLVEKNKTTVDHYYKVQTDRKDFESKKLQKAEVVVDMFANIKKLPFLDNSLDEIRLVQVFEHFTYHEANQLLRHWRKKLKDRGVLHIDIPDLEQTAYLYLNAVTPEDKDWYVRLLYGSQKNRYGIHKMMYSRASISRLLYEHGFNDLVFLPNIHTYPAFAVEAIKY